MKFVKTLFLLVLIPVFLFAQDELLDNALNFKFENVKLGITLSKFRDLYKSAQKFDNKDKDVGVICYKVASLKSASYGFFYFFENKLYSVNIIYDKNKVTQVGGPTEISSKLFMKLGSDNSISRPSPTEELDWEISWNFPNGRYFEFLEYKDGDVMLIFNDSEVINKVDELKSKKAADIGF